MPGSSGSVLPATMYGLLVGLQADAVAGAVDELLAVAGVGDDVAGRRVDASRAVTPGRTASHGRALGLAAAPS